MLKVANLGRESRLVISPKCPTGFHVDKKTEKCPANLTPKNVKIGKATGMKGFRSRFKSYYTYWPQGLLVHGILTTPSKDRRFFTYKNHASDREKLLKHILNQKKLIGFGPGNGSQKLGSEWVKGDVSTVMPILKRIAQGKDKLYGCTEDACVEVKNTNNKVQTRSKGKLVQNNKNRIGMPGRPRTRTRKMNEILENENHPLRPRVLAQIQEQNELYNNAKNKLNTDSSQKTQTCSLRGKVLKKYDSYTHYDLTRMHLILLCSVEINRGTSLGGGAESNTLNSSISTR